MSKTVNEEEKKSASSKLSKTTNKNSTDTVKTVTTTINTLPPLSAANVVNGAITPISTVVTLPPTPTAFAASPTTPISTVNVFKPSYYVKKSKNQIIPQQLTIQDAFDPEDNATVHYTVTNSQYWLSDDQKLIKLKHDSKQSSLPSSNATSLSKLPLTKLANDNNNNIFNKKFNYAKNLFTFNLNPNQPQSLQQLQQQQQQQNLVFKSNNYNLFSNNCLNNLNVKGRQAVVNSINASLNKNTSSSGYLDLVKSYKTSITKYKNTNYLADSRYMDYKRKWMEILRREKKIFEVKWQSNKSPMFNTYKLEDFDIRKTLGNGSFGRVVLVKQKDTNRFYALKVLDKKNVVKSRQVEHTLNEKKIISSVNFPFIASFICSFKDNCNLFIVLEFVNGGEMFKHLVKSNRFSENLSRFYCAQVVLAIEYLHALDIIHRDLKPENTLISMDGYIKISDFGFAKHVKTRTYTLCGTPEYLAPEIIQSKPYGKPVDWYSVGILTYEMSTGKPPFQSDQPIKIYEKILAGKYKMPSNLSEEIKDFMRCLIQADVTKRYGNLKNGVDDVKTHKWFSNIDWMAIYNKKVPPPMVPKVKGSGDTSNFDNYTEESISSSSEMIYEKEFIDF